MGKDDRVGKQATVKSYDAEGLDPADAERFSHEEATVRRPKPTTASGDGR